MGVFLAKVRIFLKIYWKFTYVCVHLRCFIDKGFIIEQQNPPYSTCYQLPYTPVSWFVCTGLIIAYQNPTLLHLLSPNIHVGTNAQSPGSRTVVSGIAVTNTIKQRSQKDSKDQESIQSSTTPVPGYGMGK